MTSNRTKKFRVKHFGTICARYRTKRPAPSRAMRLDVSIARRPVASVIAAKLEHRPEIKLYFAGVLKRPPSHATVPKGHFRVTRLVRGLADLASGYKVILSDVWGVVHNEPWPSRRPPRRLAAFGLAAARSC